MFNSLSAADQQGLKHRQEWFNNLTPDVRTALRNRWEAMSPEQRLAIRQKENRISAKDRETLREYMRSLSADKRQEISEKWPSMTPEERGDLIKDADKVLGNRPMREGRPDMDQKPVTPPSMNRNPDRRPPR